MPADRNHPVSIRWGGLKPPILLTKEPKYAAPSTEPLQSGQAVQPQQFAHQAHQRGAAGLARRLPSVSWLAHWLDKLAYWRELRKSGARLRINKHR